MYVLEVSDMSEAMQCYLQKNGAHFSEALCEFAVKKMWGRSADGTAQLITPWSKAEVGELLRLEKVEIDSDKMCDAFFVANMCKADYYGSSIETTKQVAVFISDMLNDEDGYEGMPFYRWLTDCKHRGIEIDWEAVM